MEKMYFSNKLLAILILVCIGVLFSGILSNDLIRFAVIVFFIFSSMQLLHRFQMHKIHVAKLFREGKAKEFQAEMEPYRSVQMSIVKSKSLSVAMIILGFFFFVGGFVSIVVILQKSSDVSFDLWESGVLKALMIRFGFGAILVGGGVRNLFFKNRAE